MKITSNKIYSQEEKVGPHAHAPYAHRLLIQLIGVENKKAAIEESVRIFGPCRCKEMKLVKGVYRKVSKKTVDDWVWDAEGGFMVFIPL